MPRFYPSVLISDAYGSVGEVTFYHRNGKCYYRKRSHSRYPGTAAQTSALDVHRRALAAWREVPQRTQEAWNRLAEDVEPHRPPFDHKAYITGQNLFVSAYHGFATLGNEHQPTPVPFKTFPPFAASLGDAVKMDGTLVIPARVELPHCPEASRYRLLVKIQLTAPGRCRHLGLLRNVLAEGDLCCRCGLGRDTGLCAAVGLRAGPVPGLCPVHPPGFRDRLPEPVPGVCYHLKSHLSSVQNLKVPGRSTFFPLWMMHPLAFQLYAVWRLTFIQAANSV